MDNTKGHILLRTKLLKDGRQSLLLDYYKDGKRVREAVGLYLLPETSAKYIAQNKKTRKAAEEIRKRREEEVLFAHTGVEVTTAKPSGTLLVEVIDSYYNKMMERGSVSTSKNVTSVRKIVIQFAGDKTKLAEVDETFCTNFVQYLHSGYTTQRGKHLTPNSAEALIYIFSACLNNAVADGLIAYSPMSFVKVSDCIKRESKPRCYLNSDEIKVLMNTQCPVLSRPQVKQSFLLACLCGLSFSEASSLRWKDIKNKNGQYRLFVERDKREVPLSPHAYRWLPETTNHRGLVFKGLPSFTRISLILKKWADNAGVKKDMTFGVARNTFAYLLLSSGTDLETTCALLGVKHWRARQEYSDMVDYKNRPCADIDSPLQEFE